jgi:predicted metalloprotease
MTEPFDPFSPNVDQAPPPRNRRGWQRTAVVGVAVAVAAAVVVGCGADGESGSDVGSGAPGAVVSLGSEEGSLPQVSAASIRSLQEFWTAAMPATYRKRFVDLRGGYQPKTSRSAPFTCGGQSQDYEDIKGNAFYCGSPRDDYIAWDNEVLFPRLNENFGSISPAVVLSHEMGHAIQARAGVDAETIVLELQADCFAGAWTSFAEKSQQDPVELAEGALDGAIAAILTLRDQPGTPAVNPQAHGSGFDRVSSFQAGYDDGPKRCAQFATEGVTTTEFPFRTRAEALTGGNLAYAEAVPLLAKTLDQFWADNLAALGKGGTFQPPQQAPVDSPPLADCPDESVRSDVGANYCPPTNTVSWADSVLAPIHDRIGDMASGTILSDQWGKAGQTQAGLPVDGQDAGLQRDCMTGAWIGTLGSQGLSGALLSPGDIDEALATIISSTLAAEGARKERGDAFTRTQAFRTGVLEGAGQCKAVGAAG